MARRFRGRLRAGRTSHLAGFVLCNARSHDMIPKDKALDRKDNEEPLENQPREWSEEDREMEDRKPDLGETEEDTSEL